MGSQTRFRGKLFTGFIDPLPDESEEVLLGLDVKGAPVDSQFVHVTDGKMSYNLSLSITRKR